MYSSSNDFYNRLPYPIQAKGWRYMYRTATVGTGTICTDRPGDIYRVYQGPAVCFDILLLMAAIE